MSFLRRLIQRLAGWRLVYGRVEGQSTTEYVLLLACALAFALTLFSFLKPYFALLMKVLTDRLNQGLFQGELTQFRF